jgi:L-ornithine N5-oxygenase
MNARNERCYDVVGVGFGPANIALAIALEESGFAGSVLMLEKNDRAQWFPDMLLDGSDIQNAPSRDLITPCNPRSRYSFLNYLFEHGRLLEHLNLGIEFPLRREYAEYISWVASLLARWVEYGVTVDSISCVSTDAGRMYRIGTRDGGSYLARSVVVATGRTANIPTAFQSHLGVQAFHLSNYLSRIHELQRERVVNHVCVVGGSQSAAEIMLDLAGKLPTAIISNVMRKPGYRLKDTSPFSERAFLPEFIDYYYECDARGKARLDDALQATNYSSVDGDIIKRLYLLMYEDRLGKTHRLQSFTNHEVLDCTREGTSLTMTIRETNTAEVRYLRSIDAVVLATGFKNLGAMEHQERYPPVLSGIIRELRCNQSGVLHVDRDYRLRPKDAATSLPPLYLNGLCESSHGLGDAGSFSLLSIRAARISRSLGETLVQAPIAQRLTGVSQA